MTGLSGHQQARAASSPAPGVDGPTVPDLERYRGAGLPGGPVDLRGIGLRLGQPPGHPAPGLPRLSRSSKIHAIRATSREEVTDDQSRS